MDSGGNLNCWFKSVFFVLGYPLILDLYIDNLKFLQDSNKLGHKNVLYKKLFSSIAKHKIYSLELKDKQEEKIKELDNILEEKDISKLIIDDKKPNFSNSLMASSSSSLDLPYFELYIIYFLKYCCGLQFLDLLYLESSKSKSIDDVYYFFHKFYNYNNKLIFSDEEIKKRIAQQIFKKTNFTEIFKDFFKNYLRWPKPGISIKYYDRLLDIVVVSHFKYNRKLTRYFTELSKVEGNNLLKYSNEINNKQPSNITDKVLLLNISHYSKESNSYYSQKKGKTIIKTTHICGRDIDLNKEFLLFGCLLRNNNTTFKRMPGMKIIQGKTKTIFAYLIYDTPEYEIKDGDTIIPVIVSYSIKSMHYIDDTKQSKIVDFDWISTPSSNFKDETFIITENGFDYEYNFATGDKLLLYMNVFSLTYNKILEIQSILFDKSQRRSVRPVATPARSVRPVATPARSVRPVATPARSVRPVATPAISVRPAATPAISVRPAATPAISDNSVRPVATPAISVRPADTHVRSVRTVATPAISVRPVATPAISVRNAATPAISVRHVATPAISDNSVRSVATSAISDNSVRSAIHVNSSIRSKTPTNSNKKNNSRCHIS